MQPLQLNFNLCAFDAGRFVADNYVDCWTSTKIWIFVWRPWLYTAVMCSINLWHHTPSPLSNLILHEIQVTTWNGVWCPYCGSIYSNSPSHIIIWGMYILRSRAGWLTKAWQTSVYWMFSMHPFTSTNTSWSSLCEWVSPWMFAFCLYLGSFSSCYG